MVVFLARRLVFGFLVVLATAVFAYGGIRFLRPELYAGQPWLSGTWHDVTRILLHLDGGDTCMYAGCPSIHDLWTRGVFVDLSLLAGALAIGIMVGVSAGLFCATHRGTLRARVLEALAMFFYCLPPYVAGYLLLLTFDPFFGILPVPFLVDPNRFGEPFANPSEFFRGMLMPWLVVAAPIAGACLRLTVALTAEALDEDYMRTALAKGLKFGPAVRRHAGPAARVSVASYVGAAVAGIVLNVVLVEFVFALPGFFKHTWRAFGKAPGFPPGIDYPMLQAIGVWAAVLIAGVSVLADVALNTLDPRVRAAGRVG
jgi:peptide/nickel transport system permease protein